MESSDVKDVKFELTVQLPTKVVPVSVLINVSKSNLNSDCKKGAILMHGAGGDMLSGHLSNFAMALAKAGFVCVRFTARAPNLSHRVNVGKGLLEVLPSAREECKHVEQWVLCGHSMGARVAAQVAYELPSLCLACILLSYPLHPPGREQQLRDTPLVHLHLPLLFVRGSRDRFCVEERWREVLGRMQGGQVQVHTVEGGDHGLKTGGSSSQTALEDACKAVESFAAGLVHGADQHHPGGAPQIKGKAAKAGRGREAAGGKGRAHRGQAAAKVQTLNHRAGQGRTCRRSGSRQRAGCSRQKHVKVE